MSAASVRLRVAASLLWAHLLFMAVMFGGAVYEMMVIDSAWTASLPESFGAISEISPGKFWRRIGPYMSMALMGALVASWKIPERRRWLLISLACVTINSLTAMFYFVPLLRRIPSSEGAALASLVSQWIVGAWLRLGLLLAAFIAAACALNSEAKK